MSLEGGVERVRLDVWLWRARFFKTRTLAAKAVSEGAVRIVRNGASRTAGKPAELIGPGDGLTVRTRGGLRTVEIVLVGARRGPPAEARTLYRGEPAIEDDDAEPQTGAP